MTVSKDFPLALSWCTQFFLLAQFSWRDLQNKMTTFLRLKKNWKILILRGKSLTQKYIYDFFSLGLSSRPVREDRFAPPNFDWGWKIRVLFIISLLPNITYYFIIIIQIQQHPLSKFSNTPDLHPREVFWSFDPFKVKISFKLFLIFKST